MCPESCSGHFFLIPTIFPSLLSTSFFLISAPKPTEMHQSGLPFVFVILLTLFSCTSTGTKEHSASSEFPGFPNTHCGDPLLLDVSDEEGHSLGYLEVINDSSHLWISFSTTQGAELENVFLFVGEPSSLPRSSDGEPDPEAFPLQKKDFFQDQRWHCPLEASELPDCFVLSVQFEISNAPWSEDPKAIYKGSARSSRVQLRSVFEYCQRRCGETSLCAEMDEASRHTLGPIEWAGVEADRLRKSFRDHFPEGMSLGCEENIKLAAFEDVLPALQGKDQLLAELLALRLTLALGGVEGAGPGLEAMEVRRGPFTGWSIDDLLEETEAVLGGCVSNYSASQMADVLATINRNFLPGQSEHGVLACPEN